jgi:hypothetical protein
VGGAHVRGSQRVARDEEIPPQDAPAGERGGYGDRHGREHKAAAHVLGQGTEEVGAGSGPAASGTDPFNEQPTPPGRPSSEIHTATRTFFNGLGYSPKSRCRILHRSPSRATRMASGGCHAPCAESTVVVLNEDAGRQIGPYRIAAGPGFLCRQAAPPRCVLHKTPRETGAWAPFGGAQAVG